jgi:hypothetical protein
MDDDGGQGYAGTEGEQSQGNPNWNEFYSVLPQELHSQVTPLLEKWDKGVQERFQKVHSDYEPWQPIVKSGVDPQTVQFGLNLINAIENDPYTVYSALQEHYKTDPRFAPTGNANGTKPEQGQVEPTDNDPYQRDISELKRQQQVMAQVIVSAREKELEAQQDAALDKELSDAEAKYGKFDQRYVLALMQNGMSANDAVQQFQQFVTNEAKKYAAKPLIMGTGSGIPTQNGLNPKNMDDAGRRNLALQILKAHAAED